MNKANEIDMLKLLAEGREALFDIQHVTDMMRHNDLSRETTCGVADLIDRIAAFAISTMSFSISAIKEDMQQVGGEK